MVQRALNEHKLIGELVAVILKPAARDVSKKLSLLADAINDHVRFEERQLFPHLEKKLGRTKLQSIGEHMPEEIPADEYRDDFWNWPSTL
ncbi:hypothetical protein GCM10023143_01900 [Compostibacter hankyongensis]|uniref:Hemerythrin-like domain-containing protein n=2 Tax=Compostibacter hankyongensis TaxID=1007089 RepID=A0ABP8FDH9_9BACT